MPSPINVDKLDKLLQGYDRQKSQYLVNGFRHGFSISSSLTSTSAKANKSAKGAGVYLTLAEVTGWTTW